ncbi:MAG TPA: DUF3375 family protein [Pseudonocardiaceae bacterium]
MAAKSAEQLLAEFRSNAAADVTMSLLRSNDALVHLALMAAHLGDGQVVDGETLTAEIGRDLPRLLGMLAGDDEGITEPDPDELLTRWTKKGWVHRTVDQETRVERYQLTSGAGQAVQQMRNLRRHLSIATESALSMVMSELHRIATEANPDPAERREAIDERIAQLMAEREALDRGEVPQVNHRDLVDKVSALTQLVERIPADIARYGEQMQANTAALMRQSLGEDPIEFADSLQRMFDGHDLISDSPEGQAFRAFAVLIGTPSQRAQLESDIRDIVGRVDGLPAELAASLTGFIDAMWRRVHEVEDSRRVAFRRMNNFVRGGDALHYRSMRTRIGEAQAAAAEAFRHTHGGRDIGFTVPMSGAETTSVGRLRLHDGISEQPEPLVDDAGFAIDPAELIGAESIDWTALRTAVNTALDRHGGYATLDRVLELIDEPRAGDVIGLWSLATGHGRLETGARTTVIAHTGRGPRRITLPYLLFGDRIPEPPRPGPTPRRRTLRGQSVLMEGRPHD